MNDINIEKIMEEIRAEIREKGYTEDMLSFRDVTEAVTVSRPDHFEIRELREEVAQMNKKYLITAWKPLGGGIKGFLKKVIRKFMKFYVEPVTSDQATFNSHVTRGFNQIEAFTEEQSGFAEDCGKTVQELEARVEDLQSEVEMLRDEITVLRELIKNDI